jgi:glycosyltransferase involved in cell wall biosynthesis
MLEPKRLLALSGNPGASKTIFVGKNMPEKAFDTMTLGIISDIHHWEGEDGRFFSFGPYVREIDIWNKIFGKTIIAAGKGQGPMPNHSLAYEDLSVEFVPFNHFGGSSWTNRLRRVFNIVPIALTVMQVIRRSDVIHLRTPSFSCLIAMILLLFSRKPRIAKWATIFDPSNDEQFTLRLQRLFLKAGLFRGPVMVYGQHKEPHLVSFFPAAMTRAEEDTLLALSQGKAFSPPWRILMVGRMLEIKGFDLGLKALAHLKLHHPDIHWNAVLIGEGAYLEALKTLAEELGISDQVEFAGGKEFQEVLDYYRTSHVLLMPGQREGFPKVLIEASASHTIPIAADAGLSAWILGYGSRGILSAPDHISFSNAIARALTLSSEEREAMQAAGQEWLNELTLEKFAEHLRKLLSTLE